MPTTRVPLDRGRRVTFPPELRTKCERYLVLHDAHIAAIRDEPGAESFYRDGRHDELCELSSEVCRTLGIKLWEDAPSLIEEALNADDPTAA